jgi:enoyl-CoA hydratase
MERARAMVTAMLANAPLALALCIEAVDVGYELSLDDALRHEATAFGLAAATEDMREGTQAFLAKRAPAFVGR